MYLNAHTVFRSVRIKESVSFGISGWRIWANVFLVKDNRMIMTGPVMPLLAIAKQYGWLIDNFDDEIKPEIDRLFMNYKHMLQKRSV